MSFVSLRPKKLPEEEVFKRISKTMTHSLYEHNNTLPIYVNSFIHYIAYLVNSENAMPGDETQAVTSLSKSRFSDQRRLNR